MLMRYPLSSRANELLAMNKLRLRAAVGLLTGHTSLRANLYKLGHTERQECLLCGHVWPSGLACKRCMFWCSMFLRPEGPESEAGQPFKPSGQHKAWLSLLISSSGEEMQWNRNYLSIVRVRYGTPSYVLLLLLLLLGQNSDRILTIRLMFIYL